MIFLFSLILRLSLEWLPPPARLSCLFKS